MNTVYHVTIFGLELTINRVAFTLPIGDGWPIYWYGILIALGFLLALLYAMRRAKAFGVNTDRLMDVVLVTTPLAILGARVYYMVFDGMPWSQLFDLHSGGLAIYGGVIVAALVGTGMCLLRKVKISDTLDLAAMGFLIGQAIGRWGNFFNQEAFGRYISGDSRLPEWWGMSSEATVSYYNYALEDVFVHPCFLYESIWCLAGFVILHLFSKRRRFSGQLALMYGVWYGTGRYFIEGLRTDSLKAGDLRVSQAVSAIAALVCAVLLVILLLRQKQKRQLAAATAHYTLLFTAEMDRLNIDHSDLDGDNAPEEAVAPQADMAKPSETATGASEAQPEAIAETAPNHSEETQPAIQPDDTQEE